MKKTNGNKTEETKERLLAAFNELAQNCTIDKITVRQIAEKCGVTTQTFYNHFPDKFELIHWNYKRKLDHLYDRIAEETLGWDDFIKEYLKGYKENGSYILNICIHTSGCDSYVVKAVKYFCYKMEQDFCRKLELSEEEIPEDIKILIKTYIFGFMNMVLYWLDMNENLTSDELAEILNDAVPARLREYYHSNEHNC